jgi:tetratricopeptide (TPR) repeat protein
MTQLLFRARRSMFAVLSLALLIACLSVDVAAQRGGGSTNSPIPFGDGHLLFGDLKITGPPPTTEPMYYVVLYAGMNAVQRQSVSNNGRFRFMGIPNGDYQLAVEYDGREVYRDRFRIFERQKTDVRKDIEIEMRISASGGNPPPTPSLYERSSANQVLFNNAKAAVDKKQLDQARLLLNQIVESDPKDFVAWSELGSLFFRQQKYAEAENAYKKALELKPDFVVTLVNLGKLRIEQKSLDGAIEILTKAVESDPKSAEAQHYLGEAYLLSKKGSKAVVHLNEALRLDPQGKAEIHLRLGALYNAAGIKEKAASEYEQFLAKRPDFPEKAKLQDYIKQNKKP